MYSKYNAHINEEICSSVKAVKYLYKYVQKGHDRMNVEVGVDDSLLGVCELDENVDEIKRFLDARYVSASECCWRIFHMPLYKQSPNVKRLSVHIITKLCILVNQI